MSGENILVTDAPTNIAIAQPRSKLSKSIRYAAWGLFAWLCLVAFTVMKLPEDRIRNYVNGNIAVLLAPRGIGFTSAEGKISLWLGLSYVMKDVTLTLPAPDAPIRIEKVSFSPAIIQSLLGRQGGTLWISNKDSSASISFWVKNTAGSIQISARQFDLGKLGILPIAAGVKGSGILNGTADFSGDLAALSTLSGQSNLKLSKVVIDQQTLQGFSIPKLNISEGVIDITAEKGKALLKNVKIGKPGDDIQATLTGEVVLAKTLEQSTLNAKAKFTLSETILKAFVLIDALLGAGKQPDGSYAYNLTGSLAAPVPLPGGQ